MKLEPSSPPKTDIHERFRKELREQQLDSMTCDITLKGNEMLTAIAISLLKSHNSHIALGEKGTPVSLMSMETFGTKFLAAFLEEQEPPQSLRLLYTIPEEELVAYAKRHNIPIIVEEKDDVRRMLDEIAKSQPQTYFSLAKSAQRLGSAAEQLRKREEK